MATFQRIRGRSGAAPYCFFSLIGPIGRFFDSDASFGEYPS